MEKKITGLKKAQLEDEELLKRSLADLSQVLSKDKFTYFKVDKEETLFQSCKTVAHRMGFELSPINESEHNIDNICRASDVRYRKINLKPKWWKKDHGHLVGFNQETKQYVPLLRSNKQSYYILDQNSSKKVEINETNASQIASEAVMLYHPLPEDCGSIRALLKILFKKNHREYRLIGFSGVVGIILTFFIPIANKVFFDYIIPNYDFTVFFQVFLGLIVFTVSSSVFLFTRSIVVLRLNGVIANRLQMSLWDRILKLPVSFFRSIPTGDLLQRTLIFDQLRASLSQNTLKIVFNGLFSILYLAIMLFYSWKLALAGVAIILISSCVTCIIFLMKLYYERIILRSNAKINAFLIQAIRGIAKIRIANAESRIFSIWAKLFSKNESMNLKSRNLQNIVETSNVTFNLFISLVVFGVVMIVREENPSLFSVGQYLAFSAAFGPFSQATFEFFNSLISLVTLIPFWERVRPLLTTPIEKTKDTIDPGVLKGAISVKNLHFRYAPSSPMVLDTLSFDISPGEFIGIVGHSGSGKSTLCRLMIGFETPNRGSIFYDKKDLSELNLYALRNQVAALMQNGGLFNGTLYENIVCGGNYTSKEIQRALEISTLKNDLSDLKMGLDMLVSSEGGLLSGGQRQKILLARILIRQPKIIILDEALNSIDNQTRYEILDNLETLKITRIITAHNLNTFQRANRIFVLDRGTVVDRGTFDELSKKEGIFQRFLEKQKL
ncbi:MAG: Leukotoxin export ATP-binding protein LtxB [Chlamydiae bacterium]|nr:Leukotoxin export ATP-binding protein LtxB [Chlamydiota bacterium]